MFTGNCPSSVADHPQHHLTADGPAKPKVYRKMRGFVSAGLRLLRMLALRKLLLLQNLRYLSMVLGKKKVIKEYFGLVLKDLWQKVVYIFLQEQSKASAVLHLRF